MGRIDCFCCEKLQRDFVARTFALIAPVQAVLHRVSRSNKMISNAPRHYETHQNMSLESNGMDRVFSLQQILTRLRGWKFCINFTNSICFAPSFMQLRTIPNELKYYEMYKNMSVGFKGVDRVRSLQQILSQRRGTIFCINCTGSVCFAPCFVQLRNHPK